MTASAPNASRPTIAWLDWSLRIRAVVFVLAATSILSLLAVFYGVSSMRSFVLLYQLPATVILVVLAALDRSRGSGQLYRAVLIGALAGFLAAVAYDIFRLPFVFANALGISSLVPALPLFKVFPRFGAMILGQPLEQPAYSLLAQLVGWTYHFSNGITFGVMYLALIGDALRRSWLWSVLFAVGLEMAMLVTPYPGFFSIKVTATFIAVTLTAHLVFGVFMGLLARRFWHRWQVAVPASS